MENLLFIFINKVQAEEKMNKDERVIEEFGEEWNRFEYGELDKEKLFANFQQYFSTS